MSCNDESDEREALPCAAGLMAATLALMTAWAAPEPDAAIDADTRRALIANKIVSNLFFLREHPQVGPALRGVVRNAHERWARVAGAGAGRPAVAAAHAAVAARMH